MGESRDVLVGKPEGKRPLGKPKRRWEDNIKYYDGCSGSGMGVWTGSRWLRIRQVVGTCECGYEPSRSIKCGEFLA
jgi:hypothetical protein